MIALFYIHKDDAFVDRMAREFLQGKHRGPGVDRHILVTIAVFRNTPEFDAAVMAFNPMSYEYALNEVQGSSVEKWGAQLAHVPVSIVPPLPPAKP
ncbi:MAG TPA: hypothetical protein VG734_19000 [Lacunisphaera sp.]|nr:hypothetical protein [Lacunisphaera sp.]